MTSVFNLTAMANLTQNEVPNYLFKFKFEDDFDIQHAVKVVAGLWYHMCASIVIYLVVIFGIQYWMCNREPFKLRRLLLAWNLMLAVFSIFGALRSYPEFFHGIANFGFQHTICNPRFVKKSRHWKV